MAPTEEYKDKVIPQPDFSLPPPTSIVTTGSIKEHPGVTFVAGEAAQPDAAPAAKNHAGRHPHVYQPASEARIAVSNRATAAAPSPR